MSRRPLAPDLWEQALINGRIVHSDSDQKVLAYAEDWYKRQGGAYDVEPPAAPTEQVTEQVAEQVQEAPVVAPVAEPPTGSRRSRARQQKGQYQGNDPLTNNRNEAYTEG
jgi:glutamate dehydrogenase/leucine dehydrogenase